MVEPSWPEAVAAGTAGFGRTRDFVQSAVSLEHQHLAKRYVVRGLESGGAVADLGRYVTFVQQAGRPIEYLHPVEAIGVNGLHAVVLAPVLVRIEMLRTGRTYELLITQHRPGEARDSKRPPLETKVLFRGVHGRLELDLLGKEKNHGGEVLPTFYSLAGEEIPIPKRFREAIRAVTLAVNCTGCKHSHFVRPPKEAAHAAAIAPSSQSNHQNLSAGEVA
jgi:hypothetical protein